VREVLTVFGKVILSIDLQPPNVLPKVVHADIEVGKVTDLSDLQAEKQENIEVTAFKLEGKVTLNKLKHEPNTLIRLFNEFMDDGIVILVNR
jgi:RecA-family ATPase